MRLFISLFETPIDSPEISVLRRIRRLTNNVLVLSTPATQGDADRLQVLANAAREIRKTRF
jgi:hypothetical protein